jgi:hypothetical protein
MNRIDSSLIVPRKSWRCDFWSVFFLLWQGKDEKKMSAHNQVIHGSNKHFEILTLVFKSRN